MQHYLYIYYLCCVILNSVSWCFISALETLDVDKVYVLGGLVDESIQKVWHASPQIYITALKSDYLNDCYFFFFSEHLLQKLSLGRARELSVHTARLPIDEYMVKKNNAKNFHSKILAVNQGELTVPIGKTSEYVISMNSSFPLFLFFLQCLIFCWNSASPAAGQRPCKHGSPRPRVMLLNQLFLHCHQFLKHRFNSWATVR